MKKKKGSSVSRKKTGQSYNKHRNSNEYRPAKAPNSRRSSEALPVVANNLPKGPLAIKNQCVGILRESGFDGFVEPDVGYNSTQYGQILIRSADLNGAPFGMKVICEIKNPSASNGAYEGKILEVLGNPDNGDVAMLSIIRQYGLSTSFSEAVTSEAEKFHVSPSLEEIEEALTLGRRDLRYLRTITIDGEDAKDLDDAVSIEPIEGIGYRLYVHIADVSHYVRPGSSLDEEASRRGTSVYLVDRVIPMLPPRLSNGLCSLNPDLPRFVLTAAMTVGYGGEIIDGELYESLIQSDARTSYKEVYDVLFHDQTPQPDRFQEFLPMLKLMKDLTDILTLKRQKRGALDFTFPETHVDLDKNGKPLAVYAYPITYANSMIEEFMILCNEFVAFRFDQLKYPFVYRIHEDPDTLKLKEFLHVAKLFGAKATVHSKPSVKDLSALMTQVKDEPFAPALSQLLLRALAKAKYSELNLGHFGLASEGYCHFTSPIRRYPDLFIHRIIKSYLHHENKKDLYLSQVADVAFHSSLMERNAMEAERATVDQKVTEFMSRHIGDVFDGIISSVFRGGIFVKLENTVEGLIPFRTMNDYFEFDERRLEAKGKTSGKIYRIGESVQVVVVNVDCILRRIDFTLAEPVGGGRRKVKKDPQKDSRLPSDKKNLVKDRPESRKKSSAKPSSKRYTGGGNRGK